MLLLGYLLGFYIWGRLLRKCSENTRSLLLVAYNYLFAVGMMSADALPGAGGGVTGWGEALIRAIYDSPSAISFGGDLDAVRSVQEILIFCMMSLYTVRTAFVLLFQKALHRLSVSRRIRRSREVYLLWGSREDARTLYEDISANVRQPAVVWIPFADDGTFDGEDVGFPALTAGREYLRHLDPAKTYQVVLFPDAAGHNPDRLKELDGLCAGRMRSDPQTRAAATGEEPVAADRNVHVTAFLDDDTLRLNSMKFEHLDACLVSEFGLLSRTYLAEHSPVEWLLTRAGYIMRDGMAVPQRPFRLAMAGFSGFSKAFLLNLFEQTAFETVSDPDAGLQVFLCGAEEDALAAFRLDYPAVDGLCRIEAVAGEESTGLSPHESAAGLTLPGGRSRQSLGNDQDGHPSGGTDAGLLLCGLLRDDVRRPDCILLAENETRKNILNAERLLRLMDRRGIPENARPELVVALFAREQGSVSLIAGRPEVTLLNGSAAGFSYQELILRSFDREAEALHRAYQANGSGISDWNRLDTFTQDSNRAVIRDEAVKSALIKAGRRPACGVALQSEITATGEPFFQTEASAEHKAVSVSGASTDTKATLRKDTAAEQDALLWELARYEHRRWTAFHAAHGWATLRAEELTAEERATCRTKRPAERRHACMCGWDALDALPQASPGLLKYYDYENAAAFVGKHFQES